jgi:hypothetical protein
MGRVAIAIAALVGPAAVASFQPAGSAERTQPMAERFGERFRRVAPQMAEGPEELYAADLEFRDPIARFTGSTPCAAI